MKVNGKDDIPYMKWKIKNVPNHQSDKVWYLQWPVQLEHHINLWSSGYTIWLWLTVCLGKIHPFLSSVNHLFRLGPSKNHGKLLVITRPGIYNKVWYLQQSWYLQYYWTVTVVGLWWSVTVCDSETLFIMKVCTGFYSGYTITEASVSNKYQSYNEI
jgi:hypothetical protein